VTVLAATVWERHVRRDQSRRWPHFQSPIALHAALLQNSGLIPSSGSRRTQSRSPIALHAALPQQPVVTVLAATVWERRVRRDQSRRWPHFQSPIALHAALLQNSR
jgi:hypothetical protein